MVSGKFKSARSHGYTSNRRNRRSKVPAVDGTLVVRLEFRSGLTPSELTELVNNIIVKPLSFFIFGKATPVESTFIGLITKADSPMNFPAARTAADLIAALEAVTTPQPQAGQSVAQLKAQAALAKATADAIKALKQTESEVHVDAAGNKLTDEVIAANKAKIDEDAAAAKLTPEEEALLESRNKANGLTLLAKETYTKCLSNINQTMEVCKLLKDDWDNKAKVEASLMGETDELSDDEISELDKKSSSKTTMIAIIMVLVAIGLIIAGVVYFVKNHHAFDDVYGTAGRSTYANPVYGGGGAPIGEDDGYLGVGASTEYSKEPASKKGGLVRQESMC